MAWPESVSDVRYLTDVSGRKTDVLVPIETWESLLTSWDQLVAMMEDQEDRAVFRDWIEKRAAVDVHTTSLDDFERELIADGLLSSQAQ